MIIRCWYKIPVTDIAIMSVRPGSRVLSNIAMVSSERSEVEP